MNLLYCWMWCCDDGYISFAHSKRAIGSYHAVLLRILSYRPHPRVPYWISYRISQFWAKDGCSQGGVVSESFSVRSESDRDQSIEIHKAEDRTSDVGQSCSSSPDIVAFRLSLEPCKDVWVSDSPMRRRRWSIDCFREGIDEVIVPNVELQRSCTDQALENFHQGLVSTYL